MDSVLINDAIGMAGFNQEVIDWVWSGDTDGKKASLVIK